MSDPTRDRSPHSSPTADPVPRADTHSIGEATADPAPQAPAPDGLTAPPGYELLEEIGRGGMGIVFRGRDLRLNRDVALKFLQAKYAPNSLAARRFLDEARITGQLQHPGIPPVHEVGTLPDGRPYLVMKLIKGETLADMLEKVWSGHSVTGSSESGSVVRSLRDRFPESGHGVTGPQPANRGPLVACFEQVCQAVGYAHNHGVVHCDLKPQNVMVGAFGEVQVMDWGLAKFRGAARPVGCVVNQGNCHDPKQHRSRLFGVTCSCRALISAP